MTWQQTGQLNTSLTVPSHGAVCRIRTTSWLPVHDDLLRYARHSAHRGTPTDFSVLGESVQLDRVPPAKKVPQFLEGNNVTVAEIDQNFIIHTKERDWGLALQQLQRGPLQVSILGVSTTGGCGAGEPWNLIELPFDPNNSAVGLCMMQRSWSRHFSDTLALQLPVEVSVWYKNAASAQYYATCVSHYLSADPPSVVLLEVATNVWGGDVAPVVRAIRRAAPRAAIAFLAWPSAHQWEKHPDLEQIKRVGGQPAACCMLRVACCLLLVACCVLRVARRVLLVACCVLLVTCCLLLVCLFACWFVGLLSDLLSGWPAVCLVINCLLSAVCCLLSAVYCLLSAICYAVCYLLSAWLLAAWRLMLVV